MFRCMGCMNEYDESIVDICPHCGYSRNTKATESYHLQPETILQGRYIVGRVLGFGGFGVTYIGFDAELERTVAIKEYLPSAFATRLPGDTHISVYQGEATNQYNVGLQRFVEEAQTLAQFNGIKGVVDIYDSFMSNNSAYIIMQFIRGKDVKKILRDEGVLSYERARTIVLSICDTLAPIHAKGIIHRDISPDNIYITDEGEIKLLDFGAARYESSVNSKSLSVILKSGYAPEEQYRSKGDQGSWTDVYALAATFYKMIAGRTPQDSMERAISDELQEPSKLGVELPVSSENAILNALGVRKQDRTQTVTEFKEALLSDGVERIIAKPVRREKTGLPLAAKIALGAGAFIFVGLAIFTAAGGFENTTIISGTAIEDSFGSVDSSKYATVPNLVGITQEEALASLQEIGLEGEVVEWQFGSPDASGEIISQEDVAGSQKLLGETVGYSCSVGDPMSAIEQGLIPNLMEMNYEEALVLLENARWTDTYYEEQYIYSTEAEKGHILSITYEDIYPEDDSEHMCYVVRIGMGEERTQTNDGNMELAYLKLHGRVVVVTGSYITEEDRYAPLNFNIYISQDEGNTWELMEEKMEVGSYHSSQEESIKISDIDLFNNLGLHNENYVGKPLRFKIEYLSSETNEVLNSIELQNSFTYTYYDTLEVESVEELSPEEAYTAYQDGKVGEWNDYEFENVDSCKEYTTYWKITGPFEKECSYVIQAIGNNGDYGMHQKLFRCDEVGELYIPFDTSYTHSSGAVELMVFDNSSRIDSEDDWSYELVEPAYITLPESKYLVYDIPEQEYYENTEEYYTEEYGTEDIITEEMIAQLVELYGEDVATELMQIYNEFESEEEFLAWLEETFQ